MNMIEGMMETMVVLASFPVDWTVIEFAEIAVTMAKTCLLLSSRQ